MESIFMNNKNETQEDELFILNNEGTYDAFFYVRGHCLCSGTEISTREECQRVNRRLRNILSKEYCKQQRNTGL